MQPEDPTLAELLKPHGYTSGQFGKNHLGDKDEFLPTNHGFDEFFGNLYHLNAEESPRGSRTIQRDAGLPTESMGHAASSTVTPMARLRTAGP